MPHGKSTYILFAVTILMVAVSATWATLIVRSALPNSLPRPEQLGGLAGQERLLMHSMLSECGQRPQADHSSAAVSEGSCCRAPDPTTPAAIHPVAPSQACWQSCMPWTLISSC